MVVVVVVAVVVLVVVVFVVVLLLLLALVVATVHNNDNTNLHPFGSKVVCLRSGIPCRPACPSHGYHGARAVQQRRQRGSPGGQCGSW